MVVSDTPGGTTSLTAAARKCAMQHVLEREMEIPGTREEMFVFFSDAFNLELITPPRLRFEILSPKPIPMRVGAQIEYRMRLFGVPFRWRTVIREWEPPYRFVDGQERGPYRQWEHTHEFEDLGDRIRMRDHVAWRLPMEPFGELAFPIVRSQLNQIFDYRSSAIAARFAQP